MLTIGAFLVDRYEIISKIGAGGMSDVYKAKDHILGRTVAIKVLKAEFSEDVNFVTKFRTEAQSAAGLEHPNIVNIYDVGSESGLHFIVMEYVEGITLKTYIEKKGQLSFKEATSIAIQVARGIEAAHNKNITHRDIKPQNIMISTDGKVKVTDFGIAKAISSNTLSSDAMGSVHYASPEQARNGFIDGRSDIYSLGIVMYEMVTGRVPFDGDTTVAVAIQHLQEEMVEPSAYAPEIPVSYEKIVLKTTQKSPERRYQTIGELLADLRKALISPDEDFVVIAPVVASTTRVINGDELEMIQTSAEQADMNKENGFVSSEEEEDDEDYEEEDDEEESLLLDPKMEKIVSIAGIAILAVIVIIVLFLLGNMLGLFKPSTKPGNDVSQETTEAASEDDTVKTLKLEMINIVGQDVEDAEKTLREMGLKINISDYEDTDDEDGTILKQDVVRGQMVEEGATINVVVAGVDENDLIDIVSVLNNTEKDAENVLKEAGFKVNKQYQTSSEVAKGKVISQNPNSGKATKNSVVTIVISEGKAKVSVPTDIVGKDLTSAIAQINTLGLRFVTQEEYSNTFGKGIVTKVNEAGTQVEAGSIITVYVSKGAETKYYKFSKTYTPNDTTGTISYEYSLKDSTGATVLTSGSGSGASITISKSDMTVDKGSLNIKWYKEVTTTTQEPGDGNDDGVIDEGEMKDVTKTEKVLLQEVNETVTFTAQ